MFWILFIILIISLFVAFLLIDLFVLKKKNNRSDIRNRLLNYLLAGGFVLFLLIVLLTMPTRLFFQTFLDSVNLICVLALATTGIVLIFRTSITTNFAQGTMATFGAYVAAKLMLSLTKLNPTQTLFAGLLIGAFVAFLLGLFIDVVIIRSAKFVSPVGKQMITMGLVLAISGIIPFIFGAIPYEIPRFSYDIISFSFIGYDLTIPAHFIYTFVITVSLLTVLFAALKLTKWGLGVRATASNEVVAKMMGVNTKVITAASWAIAGSLGGVAAVLLAPFGGQVTGGLMLGVQVNGFMAAILGGFSSFFGPIIGAIIIPLFSNMFAYYNSSWQNVIVYCIILLIVLIKPLGLFGKRIAKKV